MARKVFFSFHYERDIFRVSQVRNSGVTKTGIEQAGFIDHAEWESVERQGDAAIKNWINGQMKGASVLAVLIGAETAGRPWVNYEIIRAYNEGLGMLGIYIDKLKDPRTGLIDYRGNNPFGNVTASDRLGQPALSTFVPTYDWVNDNGYASFGQWVDKAAIAAGR
jgi:hypothetical protein